MILFIGRLTTEELMMVLAVLFIVVALGVVRAYFSRGPVVRRHLNGIPDKRIADFKDGEFGKITGKAVMAGNYFEAPLSKRNCVYYRIVITENHSIRRSTPYRTVLDIEEAADVVLTDGKDYAVIEGSKAQCYLIPDSNYETERFEEPAPEFKKFLSEHIPSNVAFWGLRIPRRYYEGILAPDEKFSVCGYGEWRDASTFEFELPVKRVLYIKPGLHKGVVLSDDPDVVNSN